MGPMREPTTTPLLHDYVIKESSKSVVYIHRLMLYLAFINKIDNFIIFSRTKNRTSYKSNLTSKNTFVIYFICFGKEKDC